MKGIYTKLLNLSAMQAKRAFAKGAQGPLVYVFAGADLMCVWFG